MSTYIYLTCLYHDPPLVAEDESGQHLYDLPRIRAEIADRETVAAEPDHSRDGVDVSRYFRSRSSRFLSQHPSCRIGVRDEYGRDHPVEDDQNAVSG